MRPISVIAVALFVIIVAARTGANGGVCAAPNCGPATPVVGAAGGECVGPNCGSSDNPSRPIAHGPLPKPATTTGAPSPVRTPGAL